MKPSVRYFIILLLVFLAQKNAGAQDYDYVGQTVSETAEPIFYRHAFKTNITTVFFTDISLYYEFRYKNNRALEFNLGYIRSPKLISDNFVEVVGSPIFMHKGFFIAAGYKFIFQKKTKFQFYFKGRLMYRYSGFKNQWMNYMYHTGVVGTEANLTQVKNSIGLQPLVGIILGEQLLWEFYGGLGFKSFGLKTTYNECNYCFPTTNTDNIVHLPDDNGVFYSFTLHLGIKLGLALSN